MLRAVLAEMPGPRRWLPASIFAKHILNFSNTAADGRDASDRFWPGKCPGIRLLHRLADFEIVLLSIA
jgi:hypothetical protein